MAESKSAVEIVKSFNLNYYEEEITRCKQMIRNIKLGFPVYTGVLGFEKHQGPVYTKFSDRENAISRLQQKIEDCKVKIEKYSEVISKLNEARSSMDLLARQEVSGIMFYKAIEESKVVDLKKPNTNDSIFRLRKGQGQRYFTDTIDTVQKSKTKISKEVYKVLKRKASNIEIEQSYTVSDELEENLVGKNDLFKMLFNELCATYQNNPFSMGMEDGYLKTAEKINSSTPHNVVADYYPCNGMSLNQISKQLCDIDEIRNYFPYLLDDMLCNGYYDDMEKLFELVKSTKVLGMILKAFERTAIASSSMYYWLRDILEKKEELVAFRSKELTAYFETLEVARLIKLKEQIEKTLRMIDSNTRMLEFEKKFSYSNPAVTGLVIDKNESLQASIDAIIGEYPEFIGFVSAFTAGLNNENILNDELQSKGVKI